MQNSSPSSGKEVAESTDILWEIFFRLPLKYLIRLKLVSKWWLTLISDQQFCESYSLHHHPCPTSIIFSQKYGSLSHILSFTTTTPTLRVLNLDFLNQSAVTVIRSCNGFLLCRSDSAYFICNPITRDFTSFTLRKHPLRNKSIELYLAFDPSISPHYKVISIVEEVDYCVFNEYSFKTRSWTSPGITLSFLLFGYIVASHGVYCNRAIHWCQYAEFSVYFDVDTQRLGKWPMPRSRNNRVMKYFGECGGRLYLVLTVAQTKKYDIFELKENYSGWSLRHRVDLNPLLHMYGDSYYNWGFNIVRPIKEEKSMLVLLAREETLILYDPVTLTKLCEIEMQPVTAGSIRCCLGFQMVFQYFENTTLVEACTDKVDSTCQQLVCCPIL